MVIKNILDFACLNLHSLHFFCFNHLVTKPIFLRDQNLSLHSGFEDFISTMSSFSFSEQKSDYCTGNWRKHELLYKYLHLSLTLSPTWSEEARPKQQLSRYVSTYNIQEQIFMIFIMVLIAISNIFSTTQGHDELCVAIICYMSHLLHHFLSLPVNILSTL